MNAADSAIAAMLVEVKRNPADPFLRCNVAQLLASSGDHPRALLHLSAATHHASGPVAAGCVAAAARQVIDDFARLWQLPLGSAELALMSA